VLGVIVLVRVSSVEDAEDRAAILKRSPHSPQQSGHETGHECPRWAWISRGQERVQMELKERSRTARGARWCS